MEKLWWGIALVGLVAGLAVWPASSPAGSGAQAQEARRLAWCRQELVDIAAACAGGEDPSLRRAALIDRASRWVMERNTPEARRCWALVSATGMGGVCETP